MPDRIYYSDEARDYAIRQRVVTAVFAFSLGMGIGAILALLFAPEPGAETRQMIADALEEGYQRGRSMVGGEEEAEPVTVSSTYDGRSRRTRTMNSY